MVVGVPGGVFQIYIQVNSQVQIFTDIVSTATFFRSAASHCAWVESEILEYD